MKNFEDKRIENSFDKGDDDDDKIIFNITKQKISRLFLTRIQDNKRLYYWAAHEGFRKETNGDIRIDESLKLTKRL